MKRYDVIVIGSGCGMEIVDRATARGLSVALVEPGALGGTCLNVGCIPSKMLIASADLIVEQERAERIGVKVRVEGVDFSAIMNRMRAGRRRSEQHMRDSVSHLSGVAFYPARAVFVQPKVLEVDREQITAAQVFIACGGRPFVPRIPGLSDVEYLTSDSVLELWKQPESMVIIGGGYIAVEYCHFFAAVGTRVTVLEMADRLVGGEEPELSQTLQEELGKRAHIFTGMRVESVDRKDGLVEVTARSETTGQARVFDGQRILVAVGRRPNTDLLEVGKGGIDTDTNGYVTVDEYMRTNQAGTYAVGDVNGRSMFRHSANVMAQVAAANALEQRSIPMDYSAVPHAVYSSPQIASVGLTEARARELGHDIVVTRTPYTAIAKGEAIAEEVGFTKAIVAKESQQILGFHIIGPHAAILIQEVVNAMQSGGHVDEIARAIHIHPALSEIVPASFSSPG
jgi:mycothione reductase